VKHALLTSCLSQQIISRCKQQTGKYRDLPPRVSEILANRDDLDNVARELLQMDPLIAHYIKCTRGRPQSLLSVSKSSEMYFQALLHTFEQTVTHIYFNLDCS
jgi:hypothetical protein